MDAPTFIAALVTALAWPLTVLGIFLVLRRPLLALVPLLARLRAKDLEFDFGRRLADPRRGGRYSVTRLPTAPPPPHHS
ncbi:MAG: hypothetical protein V4617_03485 [Gemmatimonadota bacterium]